MPAIARQAGVSVPTVYRHFATKQELLEAIYPHVVRRAGVDAVTPPSSLNELRTGVASIFGTLAAVDAESRAAMSSPAAEEARRVSMPQRLAMARRLLEADAPQLAAADRDRIARLLVVLTTSSTFRAWHDHLGLSVEEAAHDVDAIVRAAIAAASGGAA
jgi:AcrR family transcriptional regulator